MVERKKYGQAGSPADASSSPSGRRRETPAEAPIPRTAPRKPPRLLSVELKGAAGEMVRIHLSDGSFFVLHAEVFARAGPLRGLSARTPTRLPASSRAPNACGARRRALRCSRGAAQTRRGLARKLAARGFSAAAIRHAVARMSGAGIPRRQGVRRVMDALPAFRGKGRGEGALPGAPRPRSCTASGGGGGERHVLLTRRRFGTPAGSSGDCPAAPPSAGSPGAGSAPALSPRCSGRFREKGREQREE